MISVIVPAYNAADTLPACLRALQQQTCMPDEIIVVDDGSTDETAQIAEANGARVLRQSHQGPAVARNLGLRQAQGDIVLFTDADCEPVPEWVEQMVAPFSDARVVGTKGAYWTRQRGLIARLVQLEYDYRYARMIGLPRIDFIDSYAAAYRRELLLRYGGFDAAFPVPSAEDIDLCFRLVRAGCWLVFVPDARVWHQHPTALEGYLRRKARYGFWRALLYLRYPKKTSGDAHTDPVLKKQFVLVVLAGLLGLVGIVWLPAIAAAMLVLVALVTTMFSFVRWAWARDRAVALAWIPITVLRVAIQGLGLALGLVFHRLTFRRRVAIPDENIQRENR
jgi:glycosyltransferase involved in cell wall biosynthesis